MYYLYFFIAAAAAGLLYMYFEAGFLKVEKVRLSKSNKALKIIQISDVHINHLKVPFKRAGRVISSEKPDFVVLTGDYIQETTDIDAFLDFLDHITGVSPVYLCFGNHDHNAYRHNPKGIEEFAKKIREKNITILQNRCVQITKNGRTYDLVGLGDLRYSLNDFAAAAEQFSSRAFARIGFTHNPDTVLELPEKALDYLFCGHFHGGQIWAPFGLEFRILRKDILCKKGICKGLHKINGIYLYISRGLGNVLFPLRFLSRPEITVFYLP